MGAAEKLSGYFDPMADHAALAVLADRRHGLDGALETVECMPRAGGLHEKGFIVVIPTDFALWHKVLRLRLFRLLLFRSLFFLSEIWMGSQPDRTSAARFVLVLEF